MLETSLCDCCDSRRQVVIFLGAKHIIADVIGYMKVEKDGRSDDLRLETSSSTALQETSTACTATCSAEMHEGKFKSADSWKMTDKLVKKTSYVISSLTV